MDLENSCFLCHHNDALKFIGAIDSKPDRETEFNIPLDEYRREIYQCSHCGTYSNFHAFKFDDIYDGTYNQSTYANKIKETYDRIINLPEGKSDNKERVQRLVQHCESLNLKLDQAKVLDVGSGLCVFLGEMIKHGVEAYCIDPDPISIEHAEKNVGVKKGYQGFFNELDLVERFDIITFNKVLEHVLNPVDLLIKAKSILNEGGVIYVELPDGNGALKNEPLQIREEFFIEHYTVFNSSSILYLADQAGLTTMATASIHEPSNKYTVYSFLQNPVKSSSAN